MNIKLLRIHVIQKAYGKFCVYKSWKKSWDKFSNEFLRRLRAENKPVNLGLFLASVLYNTYQETDNQCAYNQGHDTFDNKRHASNQQQS